MPALSRKSTADPIARLACLLAHRGMGCSRTIPKAVLPFIEISLPVFLSLLTGSDKEVTALVRRSVYDAAASVAMHFVSARQSLELTIFAIRGAEDKDRAVRLKAG